MPVEKSRELSEKDKLKKVFAQNLRDMLLTCGSEDTIKILGRMLLSVSIQANLKQYVFKDKGIGKIEVEIEPVPKSKLH